MENANLDLPGIDESMLASTPAPTAPKTEVATAAAGALDLDKLDLSTLALAKFGLWRKKVADATKTLVGAVHDLSTQAKVDDAKSLRQRLINAPLADARKISKALKSKLKSVSEDVGAELDLIEAGFADAAKLITPQIEAREAELVAEKAERDAKAAARRQELEDKVAVIRGYLAAAQGLPSIRIEKGIAHLTAMVIGEEWAEFKAIAQAAVDETLAALRKLLAKTQADEAAAAEREQQRIENERVAAELAEQKRQLEEARADLKRQADELAAARAAVAPLPTPPAPVAVASPVLPVEVAPAVSVAPKSVEPVASAHIAVLDAAMTESAIHGMSVLKVTHVPLVDAVAEDPPKLSSPSVDGPARALARHALSAFDTKFPTQPKPGIEWWAELRRLATEVAV